MLDGALGKRLYSVVELNHLRTEAMNIFEQCLTNGNADAMVGFIEQQLLYRPPRLQLLRDLTDDLQQRLLSLREYHFDVRDRVVRTLSESYGVDVTSLTPASELASYHTLTAASILSLVQNQTALSDQDLLLLRKMIEASLQMASQLHHDIELTEFMHDLAVDWVNGMSIEVVKHNWEQHPDSSETTVTRHH